MAVSKSAQFMGNMLGFAGVSSVGFGCAYMLYRQKHQGSGYAGSLTVDNAVVTDIVFLQVSVLRSGKTEMIGRLRIGLFGDTVPLTSANFLQICGGHRSRLGHPSGSEKLTTFEGCKFHRVIPGFMLQGGDMTAHNGTGGRSIYHRAYPRGFPDENFEIRHGGAGTVSMANAGPNTNSSQFFITLAETPHLNGRHVVFGKLMDDCSHQVARKIESVGTAGGATRAPVIITECGIEHSEQTPLSPIPFDGISCLERMDAIDRACQKYDSEGDEHRKDPACIGALRDALSALSQCRNYPRYPVHGLIKKDNE